MDATDAQTIMIIQDRESQEYKESLLLQAEQVRITPKTRSLFSCFYSAGLKDIRKRTRLGSHAILSIRNYILLLVIILSLY